MAPPPDDEYDQAQKRLREAAELRKRLADEAAAERARRIEEEEEREEEEEEEEDEKADNTRFMSADAKLTHLRLHWALLTLLICMGMSFLLNQIDGEQMRQAVGVAKDRGELSEEDAALAERGITTFEQRKELQQKLEKSRERQRELAHKARHILEGSEHHEDEEESKLEQLVNTPLSLDSLRDWLAKKFKKRWERMRQIGTAAAIVIGGLGLVVAAFMVRIAGALVLGLFGGGLSFAMGLDPLMIGGAVLIGGLIGMWLAPRLLLASIYSNALIAGLFVGGVGLGGGVYLGSGSEVYGLLGLGVGALFGAMVAFKFARQFYLCTVLANTAGIATFILLLLWGERFEYFTQICFAGLMITDAVLTRLYHKVRYR